MPFYNPVGTLISLFRSVSNNYETHYDPGNGRTPQEVEDEMGDGWVAVDWWDYDQVWGDAGCVMLQRKKEGNLRGGTHLR